MAGFTHLRTTRKYSRWVLASGGHDFIHRALQAPWKQVLLLCTVNFQTPSLPQAKVSFILSPDLTSLKQNKTKQNRLLSLVLLSEIVVSNLGICGGAKLGGAYKSSQRHVVFSY
jgi:hypothetical protein